MYICILMFVSIIHSVTKGTSLLLLCFLLKVSGNYFYLRHKGLIDCILFDVYYKRYIPFVEQCYPFFESLHAFVEEMHGNCLDLQENTNTVQNEETKIPDPPITSQKYEDKYLDKIRAIPEEYIFSKEEEILEAKMFIDFFKNATETLEKDKTIFKNQLACYQQELSDIENMEFSEEDKEVTYSDEDGSSIEPFETQMEHKKTHCAEQVEFIKNKLIELNDKQITETEIKELVHKTLLNERLDKLKNNFIIETTPLGNVLMFYNNKKETFEYYSDSTIPYRVLEVVCRKYVLTYNCRFLYIDMEQELQKYEQKMAEKEKQQKEIELLKTNSNHTQEATSEKKSVFAKFKSYNKEASSGKVNKAPPPKNSIPNNQQINTNKGDKVVLKEKSNHYTQEGKLSNFNILKKIERKVVDKKYAMTFADFKKNILTQK